MNTSTATDWVPDTSTFGARLALLRWKMGWNIREAERKCGISQNNWSGWEQGKAPRKIVEVVSRIHWATGVNRDWLLFGVGNPNGPVDGGPSNDGPYPANDDNLSSLDAYRNRHAHGRRRIAGL